MKAIFVTYIGPDATSPDLGPLTAGDTHYLPADVLTGPNWSAEPDQLAALTDTERAELGLEPAKSKPAKTKSKPADTPQE